MKELIELNKRLRAEVADVQEFQLGRRGGSDGYKRLPAKWRAEIDQMEKQIRSAVPDDVSCTIFLGGKDADVLIEYEDGPQTAACGGGPKLEAGKSLFEQLENYDWGTYRAESLAGCQAFGQLLAAVKDDPGHLPTTVELQRRFGIEMQRFHTKSRNCTDVRVFMYHRRDGSSVRKGFYEERLSKRDELPGFCVDFMMMYYWIITVVENGKPLSVEEIDAVKNLALTDMRDHMPISYAKALGKL
jgi:hypothetical protein